MNWNSFKMTLKRGVFAVAIVASSFLYACDQGNSGTNSDGGGTDTGTGTGASGTGTDASSGTDTSGTGTDMGTGTGTTTDTTGTGGGTQ